MKRWMGLKSLLVATSVMMAVAPAHPAAPMARFQSPGFYRMTLGDFEVTALNDGVVNYRTADVLPTATWICLRSAALCRSKINCRTQSSGKASLAMSEGAWFRTNEAGVQE